LNEGKAKDNERDPANFITLAIRVALKKQFQVVKYQNELRDDDPGCVEGTIDAWF
jgi:hypothetical protein